MFLSFIILTFTILACDLPTDIGEIGDTQSDGQISLTVNDVFIGEETLFGELPEGEIWLQIEVTLQNVGQVRRTINTLLMFELEDEFEPYDVDIFAIDAGELDGDLNVGERKTGVLTFAVNENSETFILYFTPNINQPGTLQFEINLNDE